MNACKQRLDRRARLARIERGCAGGSRPFAASRHPRARRGRSRSSSARPGEAAALDSSQGRSRALHEEERASPRRLGRAPRSSSTCSLRPSSRSSDRPRGGSTGRRAGRADRALGPAESHTEETCVAEVTPASRSPRAGTRWSAASSSSPVAKTTARVIRGLRRSRARRPLELARLQQEIGCGRLLDHHALDLGLERVGVAERALARQSLHADQRLVAEQQARAARTVSGADERAHHRAEAAAEGDRASRAARPRRAA